MSIYLVALIGPIMTIPQVWKIWANQTAAGVSVLSWGTYVIIGIFWLMYGMIHREKPLIFSSTLWIIVQLPVVIGTLIYG